MKKLLTALSFAAIVPSYGMDKESNAQKQLGYTPLHCVALIQPPMMPFDESNLNLPELDMNKAAIAALLIIRNRNDVYSIDNDGKTPIDYATINKDKLPSVYEVIMAGKIKTDIEREAELNVPKPVNNQFYTYIEHRAVTNYIEEHLEKSAAWNNAMMAILKYIPKVE
ncbi:MAG: hypothetical protein WCE21_02950 [Candidatus Babeliales bacterium]